MVLLVAGVRYYNPERKKKMHELANFSMLDVNGSLFCGKGGAALGIRDNETGCQGVGYMT